MPIFDVSRSIGPGTAHWPGDTPFSLEWPMRFAESGLNVGAFRASTHFATHIDAPFHFTSGGAKIDSLDLAIFTGSALVVDVRSLPEIGPERLPPELPERVLLRTDAWPLSDVFPTTIPTLTLAAVASLQNAGVRLLGIDVPSVDQLDSKDLPIHHALLAAGITILESLDLDQIASGYYDLAAFPLRIAGGDASPVRAVLISLPAD